MLVHLRVLLFPKAIKTIYVDNAFAMFAVNNGAAAF